MSLLYAYRIVKDDRIKGTLAPVDRTEFPNEDEVEIHFKNGVSRTFRQDAVLTVSSRGPVLRPKYRPGHKRNN